MPFDVLVAIFECCDGKNNDEREDDETGGYGRELGEELEDRNASKEAKSGVSALIGTRTLAYVHVCNSAKLLE
jgi:hypothetical protein